MRKITAAQKLAITKQMFADIASYISIYCTDPIGAGDTNMYCNDIAHNVAALHIFAQNNNVQQLHDNIIEQDTLVREHFISVLRYIEDNKLIPAENFCCR
jgi:hypothetical protein